LVQIPTDLKVEKIEQKQNGDKIFVNFVTLSFLPSSSPDIAGYKLYFSFDEFTHYYLNFYLAKDLKEYNGRIYIEQELIDLCDGREVWFKLKAFTYNNEESDFSIPISTITKASISILKHLYFDTKNVYLEVENIPTDSGKNFEFLGFNIYKEEVMPITYSVLSAVEDQITLSGNFQKGKLVFVKHVARNAIWKGIVDTEGFFILDKNTEYITDISIDYAKITDGDLNVFVEKDNKIFLQLITSTGYIEPVTDTNKVFLYSITSITPGQESLASKGFVEILYLPQITPMIRRLEQSNPEILSLYWKQMKDSLHDENYYLKEPFDVPFIDKEKYKFLIYVGIAKVDVSIWINEKYLGTIQTDEKGEASFESELRRKNNLLKFRLKNYDGTIQHPNDFTLSLNTLFMYLFFLVFGILLEETKTTMDTTEANTFVSTCSSEILKKFSKLVGIYRVFGWTIEEFRETIQKLMLAFNYPGTIEGIERVLNAFNMIDRFEFYEYLEPWRTIRVKDFLTSTGYITTENFLYGISACKDNGEETIPSLVRIDKRWHNPVYESVNIFEWTPVMGADFYRIYRGNSSATLEFLTSTGGTRFIDYNIYSTNSAIMPLNLQYASIDPPKEVKRLFVRKVREEDFYYYSGGHLKVIIFGKRELLKEEKEIIFQTLRRIIPAELKLEIVFADISGVSETGIGYGYNYGFDYGIGL